MSEKPDTVYVLIYDFGGGPEVDVYLSEEIALNSFHAILRDSFIKSEIDNYNLAIKSRHVVTEDQQLYLKTIQVSDA